jgi:hypothetical protein
MHVTCAELSVGSVFCKELQLPIIKEINWKRDRYVLFELKVESLPIQVRKAAPPSYTPSVY